MPPGTSAGFPVAKLFGEEGRKLDTPFAQRLVTHLNAALMQQFLDIPVTQGKALVKPDRVLDDRHRETVAVRLGIGHVGSAYPSPIKATQPSSTARKVYAPHELARAGSLDALRRVSGRNLQIALQLAQREDAKALIAAWNLLPLYEQERAT